MRRAPRFQGWKVVAAAFLLAVFAWGIGFYGPGVFIATLAQSRGWSIALLSGAVTLHFLLSAALVAQLPDWHRRFGIAAVTRAGIAASGLGVAGRGAGGRRAGPASPGPASPDHIPRRAQAAAGIWPCPQFLACTTICACARPRRAGARAEPRRSSFSSFDAALGTGAKNSRAASRTRLQRAASGVLRTRAARPTPAPSRRGGHRR